MKRKTLKIFLIIFGCVCVCLPACSTGSGAASQTVETTRADAASPYQNNLRYAEGEAPADEAPTGAVADYGAADLATTAGFTDASQVQPDKIIQTASIEMQTDRFGETVDALRAAGPDNGGYVESANLEQYDASRYFYITLRVPAEKFGEVCKYAESLGKVLSSSQNAEDVSASYYDTADRLDTKLIEEERVLDMITRATKIDDLLALEERLGEIREQIEVYQSRLTSIDRQALYSTIAVSLEEVRREALALTSEGLGGRIQSAFIGSVNGVASFFQNAVIFLAGVIIPLLFAGLLVFIGVRVAKAAGKGKKD
ncbi:MAG: DUF4349 domain-containing protein [Clostridiales bacterium]|jgi:hypothetical protein|nr:DUF4349 domain-containing protein [Clostridiales bacterium]